ncbi:hypothetical protein NDU88_013337 [Pleurodeles waltl]|uniref:Uncharacterized protein n=1 Tax=Pleurodeles waltl TaxID=8319 RepID=A0AAV7R4C5_PLEWA|nr:hypothetical protein NDU88_013337 [Pleurodeles waltl]
MFTCTPGAGNLPPCPAARRVRRRRSGTPCLRACAARSQVSKFSRPCRHRGRTVTARALSMAAMLDKCRRL